MQGRGLVLSTIDSRSVNSGFVAGSPAAEDVTARGINPLPIEPAAVTTNSEIETERLVSALERGWAEQVAAGV